MHDTLLVLACYLATFLGCWSLLVMLSSDWEYRLVNNEVKMAYMVRLPGFREYIDLDATPPVVRRKFSMWAYYRVSPWYTPDDIDQ